MPEKVSVVSTNLSSGVVWYLCIIEARAQELNKQFMAQGMDDFNVWSVVRWLTLFASEQMKVLINPPLPR